MLDSRAGSREEIPAVLFNYKTKRTVSEMFFRLKYSFINSELLVVFTLGLRAAKFYLTKNSWLKAEVKSQLTLLCISLKSES